MAQPTPGARGWALQPVYLSSIHPGLGRCRCRERNVSEFHRRHRLPHPQNIPCARPPAAGLWAPQHSHHSHPAANCRGRALSLITTSAVPLSPLWARPRASHLRPSRFDRSSACFALKPWRAGALQFGIKLAPVFLDVSLVFPGIPMHHIPTSGPC